MTSITKDALVRRPSKWVVAFEVISASLLLVSKIFLAQTSTFGWVLSSVGYGMVSAYNVKRKFLPLAVNSGGAALLGIYGLYKWHFDLKGLEVFDYLIITGMLSMLVWLWKKTDKSGVGILQFTITTCSLLAFVCLSVSYFFIGWLLLLVSHAQIGVFYTMKKSWFYVALQVVSFIVAAGKLWTLI